MVIVDSGGGGGGGGSGGSSVPTAPPKDDDEEELNRAIALSLAGDSDMVDNDMPPLMPSGDHSSSGAQRLGPSAPPGTERGGSFTLLEKILRSKWPRIDVTVLGSLPPQLE